MPVLKSMRKPKSMNGRLLLVVAPVSLLMSTLQVTRAQEERQLQSEEPVEPFIAILFPWFAEILGVFIFYLVTRYFKALPITAVMFLLGVVMGAGATRLDNGDQLAESIMQWIGINSDVLLLVFLPGLLFNDAFVMDVYLFRKAFRQLIILAFPMVLAGTCLTALVGYFFFPYNWSWNLAMTFGSILAATDPVAVCALLESVGAPPRLMIHISGESMLNDGSAYVFYIIFSALFLTELGIPGLGEQYTVAEGFGSFFQLSLGGMGVGIAFGLGLVFILYYLDRRLNTQENVLQIAATITVAYLAYYVADIAATSGVISVVMCGVTTKAFGGSMINDAEMMESFWMLVVQLLNTLLFALAGTVWGSIIGTARSKSIFLAKDWGYLIVLYVLLNAIRFILVGSFYPVVSRIGLKSDWQEAVFSSFSGLRGAVGIALSISLYTQVQEAAVAFPEIDISLYEQQATQLFAMIGGVAFLTLVINGTLAGPLLIKLGLAASSDTRVQLLQIVGRTTKAHATDEFVKLLADPRFVGVDFRNVAHHVSLLKDLTLEQLKSAVLRNKQVSPNLENVLPYLMKDDSDTDFSWASQKLSEKKVPYSIWETDDLAIDKEEKTKMDAIELRKFFVQVLRATYTRQTELDGRDGLVTYVLLKSLDFEMEYVSNGEPLTDWEISEKLSPSRKAFSKYMWKVSAIEKLFGKQSGSARNYTAEYQELREEVHRALAFIKGHRNAKEYFLAEVADASGEFREAVTLVDDEIEAQVLLAEELLKNTDKGDLQIIVSHEFCTILLNRIASYVEKLMHRGILQEREASGYLDTIGNELDHARTCCEYEHPSQLAKKDQFTMVDEGPLTKKDEGQLTKDE